MEKATFAAGCFWGVEEKFSQIDGVTATAVGYSDGTKTDPSYEEVCTGTTGHAEVCQVEYDPEKVSFDKLLEVFWSIHDPTTLNRQGVDVGTQYRSGVYFHNDQQKEKALSSKESVGSTGTFSRPIVTEIKPASTFYRAEEYHQQYIKKKRG